MFHTYVVSLQVFYLDVSYVCNGFQTYFRCFFQVFSEACFKYFIYCRTYVVSVVSGCFKSISSVAHRMHVESERGHEQSPRAVWWCGRCPDGVSLAWERKRLCER
jgi:hypothetical protein